MLQLKNDPMSLLDADDEELDRHHRATSDPEERELTLSTGAILGIFFGLVLLCGLFFGFGYKIGSHKTAPTLEPVATADSAATPSANFGAFKPAAGSPAGGSSSPQPPKADTPEAATPAPPPADASDTAPAAPPSAAPLVHPATPPPVAPTPTATAAPAGSFVVQVAAVSHQEDADLLVGALKAKGYPAAARTVPQDKLFRIQVGPFANRKDADTVRQRLLGEGYNPVVK